MGGTVVLFIDILFEVRLVHLFPTHSKLTMVTPCGNGVRAVAWRYLGRFSANPTQPESKDGFVETDCSRPLGVLEHGVYVLWRTQSVLVHVPKFPSQQRCSNCTYAMPPLPPIRYSDNKKVEDKVDMPFPKDANNVPGRKKMKGKQVQRGPRPEGESEGEEEREGGTGSGEDESSL